MPIHIKRQQIEQLANAVAARHEERKESVGTLAQIFAASFDASAWAEVCAYAARQCDWVGALFNQNETANQQFAFGDIPECYALIAADGSQILPNRHSAIQYYFLQAASACIVYGIPEKSQALCDAEAISKTKTDRLEFDTSKLFIDGEMIGAGVVSNQRDVMEIELMAARCKLFDEAGVRPIVLADGSIVPFALLNPKFLQDRKAARELFDRIVAALNTMRKHKAIVAGYIDRPDSNAVVKAARLAGKPMSVISKQSLRQLEEGALPMFDRDLLRGWLQPQQRTALFDPAWQVNGDEWLGRHHFQMRACYVNVGAGLDGSAILARVELPAFCADQIGLVCAVLQRQANLGVGYPFILKAAHEEAVVTKDDQQSLETLIQMELRARGIRTDVSLKQAAKNSR